MLQNLNIDGFKFKPPDCIYARSQFMYNATDHAITDDVILTLSTTLLCQQTGRNIVNLNPKIGQDCSRQWRKREKRRHIYCFLMWGLWFKLPRRILRKRNSWAIIILYSLPLIFQLKMRNFNFRHFWIPKLHKSSLPTTLYWFVCQLHHDTFFQINMIIGVT